MKLDHEDQIRRHRIVVGKRRRNGSTWHFDFYADGVEVTRFDWGRQGEGAESRSKWMAYDLFPEHVGVVMEAT